MAELLISRMNSAARALRSLARAPSACWTMLIAGLLLASCAGTRGGPVPYDVKGFGAPDAPAAVTLEEGYRIAPLDKIRVTVFQVADLSGEYQVDLTGNIGLPLIGSVQAVGLTTDELRQRLVQRLGERYLANPDVTVGITESSSRTVTVDGSVRRPGAIPMPARMTLMQAVAQAGGTDENANPRRVAIFRQIQGQQMVAGFDLVSIRRGEAEDPAVYRGDIIVVDGNRLRAAQRELLGTLLPIFTIFRPF